MLKHRTFIFLVASLLAAFIVSSAVAQVRGIVPVPIKDMAGNQVGLYKGSYALVIGVSDYTEGWQDLESVPNEVNDLVSALEAQGFHVVKVMNPDSESLEKSFKDFIAQYGFDPDNRLLFFFSGHGYTRQVGNITKGYLVPTDAPIPEHDPKGFKNKALSMKQIITWAEGEIESKHALFLFDSCFSGTILTSRSRPPIPHPIRDSTNHPVRQFISAGTAGQLVPSQSVFAPYFIRALKGDGDLNRDGYVTGTELGLYLRDQIMGGDTHQTPQVGKSFNPNFNEGDFVFSLLGREQMEQSVDSIVREREKLKQDRLNLEEERKQVAALQNLQEEKQKLEEEKRLFKKEQDRLARLQPKQRITFPPDYIQALNSYRSGNYDESILLFKRLWSANPPEILKDNIIYWIGNCYMRLEMYEEAIGQYEIIINSYPRGNKVHDSRFMLGRSYYHKGETSRAIEILQAALLKNPPAEVRMKILKQLNEIQSPKAYTEEDKNKLKDLLNTFSSPHAEIDPIKKIKELAERKRLRKERELVERKRILEEQTRELQELEKKEKELAERKKKEEGKLARGVTVYGTKYQLENDPHGERIDDPLTPQDERYYCGDPGNCFFDKNDDPIVYE